MNKYEPLKCWSFAWLTDNPKPYITKINAWTRQALILRTEKEMDMTWKKIYRRGGRAIKTITIERI